MLYDIGFGIFSVAYLPTLIAKGKLHRDFGERFGKFSAEKRAKLAAAKEAIWVQAVSVGEVALLRSLVPLLRKRFPASTIVISTITKTGNDLARKLFADEAIIIYFPLDFTGVVRRVVGLIRPRAYVMIETEIWPNVLRELARRRVPSVLMNGRISDRSIGSYMAVRRFLRPTLGRITAFCMQSDLDAERIRAMGAPSGRVRVTGTMKYDLPVQPGGRSTPEVLRSIGLTGGDELIVAGSTHPGEEEAVLAAYKALMAEFPKARLLIAPRHIDRVPVIESAVRSSHFLPIRVSQIDGRRTTGDGRHILILDTIGRLGGIYAAATVVFIGGSLIPHGGQNPIEPALLERAVIFGPFMHNFRTVAADLVARGGAVQVAAADELGEALRSLMRDPKRRAELGARAKAAVEANRGAAGRNIEVLATYA